MTSFKVLNLPASAIGERCLLGENPFFSVNDARLYWVDIFGKKLFWLDLTTGETFVLNTSEPLCWVIATDQSELLAGFQSHISLLNTATGESALWCEIDGEPSHNRLNDAGIDHFGNLWFGSMDNEENQCTGGLYLMRQDQQIVCKDKGYKVTNGPAHCVISNRLYHADSTERTIFCFDIKSDGTLNNKRVFATFSSDMGFPDGMAVDDEGSLWVAQWGGSGIVRFLPDGQPDIRVAIDAPYVTNLCFVGERLFVTTSNIKMTSEQKVKYPDAGRLFEIDISGYSYRGVYPPTFKLT